MANLIQPRTLKGFRDFLPDQMVIREHLIGAAKEVFHRYGYGPIDTPALEYQEILTGKGSEETDRQMYAFEDHGKRRVGLRFDLTVPLARFAAQHVGKLGTPFKRYHIAPVWRGENTQAGRYREFMQCDFDTIGTESVAADIETALVINALMKSIGVEGFRIRINNRQILTGLLENYGLADRSVAVLRGIDKLDKIGANGVSEELRETADLSATQSAELLGLLDSNSSPTEQLDQLATTFAANETGIHGVDRIRQILDSLSAAGMRDDNFTLDLTIARGLDYYTGVVYETILTDLPSIGSVCSGGRYDNLAGLYTKQHLPGIGASLGLDRFLAALEQLDRLPQQRSTADVLVAYFDKSSLGIYVQIASILRDAGISTELYPEPKQLGKQLKYADQRRFPIAIIAGADEIAKGSCQVKQLATKSSSEVNWQDSPSDLITAVRAALGETGNIESPK